MKLSIELSSTECNGWPTAKVVLNSNTLCETQVVGSYSFNAEVDINDTNTITISMLGKQFGPRYNTKVVNGVIVADQSMTIEKIEFDDVTIKPILDKLVMHAPQGDYDLHSCKYFYNSSLTVDFTSPIYNWIITERFIKGSEQENTNTFGSWNNKFNYAATEEYLQKIQKLL